MTKFLKPALVEAIIAAQGTKFFSIEFAKKNGDVVTKNVRAKMASRRVQEDASEESKARAAKQAQTLVDNGLMFFDYPQVGARGCSVYKNRVVSINGTGATVASAAA